MNQASFLRMQPTFNLRLNSTLSETLHGIQASLMDDSDASLAGSVVDLRVPNDERRFWSPHLSVQFWSDEMAGVTVAEGRFSPRPEVWTMFAGIYAVMVFVLFVSMIYAFAQWMLGQTPWALMVLPAGLAVIGILHMSGLIGQKLSACQMDDLRRRLDRLVIDVPAQ